MVKLLKIKRRDFFQWHSVLIFIDMFAPKWARGPHNLACFPSLDPCITPGYWAWYLNVLPTPGSLFRSLFYAFMSREGTYSCVFCPPPRPPPLSDKNPVMLHFFAYAKIIFAHILVFPACAIEVQHIDENSPTILVSRTVRSSNCCIFEMKGASGLETCTKIYFLFIFNLMYIRIRKTSLLWLCNLMTWLWKPSVQR